MFFLCYCRQSIDCCFRDYIAFEQFIRVDFYLLHNLIFLFHVFILQSLFRHYRPVCCAIRHHFILKLFSLGSFNFYTILTSSQFVFLTVVCFHLFYLTSTLYTTLYSGLDIYPDLTFFFVLHFLMLIIFSLLGTSFVLYSPYLISCFFF